MASHSRQLTTLFVAQVRKNRKGMKAFQISEVDPESVPYLDQQREAQRKKRLSAARAAGKDAASLKAERTKERERLAGAASSVLQFVKFLSKLNQFIFLDTLIL